jgi:DNA mismatch endonuclease (patch repair protein)
MAKVRSKHTKPEMVVRKAVLRLGFRYRLHRKDLPGKPDLVFLRKKKVIFVHGCFWHGHSCPAGKNQPRSNTEYWLQKLERNKARDQEQERALRNIGWDILVIWECQVKDTAELSATLSSFLGN